MAMSTLTKTRANITISWMEVRLSTGTIVLGYQGQHEMTFVPALKTDPYGRLTTIGYRMHLKFQMHQNTATEISKLAGYVKNDAAAPMNIYGFTIGLSAGLVQIADMKAVFSFQFKNMEFSPILVEASKALSIADFYSLFYNNNL